MIHSFIHSIRNISSHYICFYLNDCSSPADSFETTAAIIDDYVSTECLTAIELQNAKGSAYFSLCSSMDSPAIDVLGRFIQDKPLDYTKHILKEVESVTLEEVRACMKEVYTKIVNANETCMVLTCSEDKVEEYMEEFTKLGYQMEEKKYETL